MNPRFTKCIMVSFFCFILFISLFTIPGASASTLKISYINNKESGFILIQTPNQRTMLIDSGTNKDAPTVIQKLKAHRIKKIDILVATNANDDRIGAMDEMMKQFKTGHLYIPKVNFMSRALEDLLMAARQTGLVYITRNTGGLSLDLDPDLKIEMLTPYEEDYKNPNDFTAALKLTYGKTAFLLAGDATRVSLQEILKKGPNLKANLLMAGRQGKNTIINDKFLAAVSPDYAVISPNITGKTIVTRMQKAGLKICQARANRTIIAESNGTKISLTER
ncbi:MAG: MBL fold metallo-hydrolase [Firmicutes bacterium]|nr:MBL fold metallo-hydrolase [Bacillota bacterium]